MRMFFVVWPSVCNLRLRGLLVGNSLCPFVEDSGACFCWPVSLFPCYCWLAVGSLCHCFVWSRQTFLIWWGLGFPMGRDSATFWDKGTMGQAKNLAKGRDGPGHLLMPSSLWPGTMKELLSLCPKKLKSVNLRYITVGRLDDDMIVPPSDGAMFILIDWE